MEENFTVTRPQDFVPYMTFLKFLCTNVPANNVIVERVWKTMDEIACCMLEDFKRPETYWEDARRYSGYIYNRISPTRELEKGPWENPLATHYKGFRDSNLKHLSIPFFKDVLALYRRIRGKDSIMVIKRIEKYFVVSEKTIFMASGFINQILDNGLLLTRFRSTNSEHTIIWKI